MNRIHYIIIGALALLLLICGFLGLKIFSPLNTDEVLLRVERGDNAGVIASKLSDAGLIRSPRLFRLLAKITGADRKLKAGVYKFGGKINLLRTVQRLQGGHSHSLSLTIPEGLSLYAVLHKISKSGLADYDSLAAVANDPVVIKRLTGMDLPSLEGFLYPETYRIELGTSPEDILKIQTTEFFKILTSAGIKAQADSSFYSKLILASIVESESMYEDERVTVAGVYYNRLADGMKLEACPTVDYVLEQQGIHREVLSLADIAIDSPYNTYVNPGLPPTPICNPSISSIQAAYAPQKHDYFFFQADRKGRNVFSRTYREHLQKMADLPSRVEKTLTKNTGK
ncbi:MAG TPA: endolytic transglycosylase MltG [Candidatus Cloacimonadota bacterium]|nr:endolytic transglycosylase MltG [Candidatus Cloacimonadota bacterium]